jgi:hypothetical protein
MPNLNTKQFIHELSNLRHIKKACVKSRNDNVTHVEFLPCSDGTVQFHRVCDIVWDFEQQFERKVWDDTLRVSFEIVNNVLVFSLYKRVF